MTSPFGHRPAREEDGFTLIEVVIAMLLMAIVLSVMFAVILDMFRSGERTQQRNKAQRAVVLATEKLSSDIRAMRAPDRTPRILGGIDRMRELYTLFDEGKEIHDITTATNSRLVFFAEINNTSPGPECVEWVVRGADKSLRRRVYPGSPRCGGAVAAANGSSAALQDEEILPAPDLKNATNKYNGFEDLFTYHVTYPAGENTCTSFRMESAAGFNQTMDRIVTVEMDLRTLLSVKGARGDQHYIAKTAISSRQQFEYQYAIGCAG